MIFFLANVEFRACPVEGRKTIAELSSARKRDLSRNVAQAARLVGKPRQRASQGLGDDDERSESRRLFRFIHFLVIVYRQDERCDKYQEEVEKTCRDSGPKG